MRIYYYVDKEEMLRRVKAISKKGGCYFSGLVLPDGKFTISNSIGQFLFKRGDIRDFYNKPEVPIDVPENGSVRQLSLW